MNRISCCIVVHNEEKTIERSLKSLKGIVQEIIIVHDGPCKDKSLEISKKYTSKIYVKESKGSCEGHFPFFLKKAKYEWILLLDPDEIVSKELAKNLKNLINSKEYDGYEIYWPTYYGNKKLELGLDKKSYKRILFRKSKARLKDYLHSKREVDGKVAIIDYPLIHRPKANIFSDEYLNNKSKWATTGAKLLEPYSKSSPIIYFIKAPIWFCLYIVYYLFFRLWITSGKIGYKYALCFAKYNFMLNWNLAKLKMKKH